MSRKQEVVNVLLEKIKDGGLNVDFTISELAKAVDIGKSTIYEYFDTKEAIIDEAFKQIIDQTVESLLSYELNENSTFEESLKGMLRTLFELGMNHSYLMRFIQIEYQEKTPAMIKPAMLKQIQKLRDHYEKQFTEIMMLGVTEGILVIDYDMKKAFMIQAIVAGGIMRFLNCNVDNQITAEEAIEAMYDSILMIAS